VTVPRSRIDAPRYLLVLAAVVAICSAVASTDTIGPDYAAALNLPAVLTFAVPIVVHLTTTVDAAITLRSTDPHRYRATRRTSSCWARSSSSWVR
jgi:hypothetical protein